MSRRRLNPPRSLPAVRRVRAENRFALFASLRSSHFSLPCRLIYSIFDAVLGPFAAIDVFSSIFATPPTPNFQNMHPLPHQMQIGNLICLTFCNPSHTKRSKILTKKGESAQNPYRGGHVARTTHPAKLNSECALTLTPNASFSDFGTSRRGASALGPSKPCT